MQSPAGAGAAAPADDSALLVLGRFENGQAPEAEDANGAVTVAFRDITDRSEGITALVETERASTQSAKHGEWGCGFRSLISIAVPTACNACRFVCLMCTARMRISRFRCRTTTTANQLPRLQPRMP